MRSSVAARGIAATTRPAKPRRASTTAPITPPPATIPTPAPNPAARIAVGDVMARATGGVKNRSRSDIRAMSQEATTANPHRTRQQRRRAPVDLEGEPRVSPRNLEVGDDGYEDLGEAAGVAGVGDRGRESGGGQWREKEW